MAAAGVKDLLGGLTKILHGLERRGLIARVADGADRRSRRVRLTPAGRALCERCVLALKASWASCSPRGSEDMGRLTGLLRKLLFALEPGAEPETSAPTKSNRGSKRDRRKSRP